MKLADVFRAFRTLEENERDALVSLCESIGLDVRDCPPAVALIAHVAVSRLAVSFEQQGKTRRAAHRQAAELLGLNIDLEGESFQHPADSLLKTLGNWRQAAAKRRGNGFQTDTPDAA